MRNDKRRGITFIALVITIVVALIIVSAVVISYESIMQNTRKSEFAKEMYTVKKLVQEYEFMNSTYPLKDEITVDLNSIDEDSKIQFSDEPGYSSNSIVLSEINLSKAGVESIIRGTTKYGANDIYAFSTSTKKIYYLLGEPIGDNTYYTLTEELYDVISIYDVE